MSAFSDPLREARQKSGILKCPFHGEDITMLLRHEDVRQAAKDWQTFSSDAPFRVPIPSEEAVRTMRQLPIETNPPEHGDYRAIVEPFFARAKDPAVIAQVEALIADLLDQALARNSVEIVNEFALPVQSRALTHLLNVPASEGEIWLGWGILAASLCRRLGSRFHGRVQVDRLLMRLLWLRQLWLRQLRSFGQHRACRA